MRIQSIYQNELGLLLRLAAHGAMANPVSLSTTQLALELQVSQQTASRWLSELARQGWIERSHGKVWLTEKSKTELGELKTDMAHALQTPQKHRLSGMVTPGMGEGKYYLSKAEYQTQLHKLLGYQVFPGTLNLRLSDAQSEAAKKGLPANARIEMEPFHKEGRTFGGAWLYPCTISNPASGKTAHGAIIVPHKTHHGPEIVELVSEFFLRKKLDLKDGNEVIISVD